MEMFAVFLFIIIATTGILSTKTRGGYKEAIESCNHYIDDMLSDIMIEHGENLDPYAVQDSILIFHRKVVFVDVKGEAKLTSGYLSGLSKLQRITPCSLSFEDDRLKLSAKLQIEDMTFNATGSLKFLNMGPDIIVNGNSSGVFVNMAFTLNFTTGREALLEEFNLDTIREMHIWVNGLRLLKWLNSAVQNSALTLLKILTRNAIEYKIRDLVTDKIILDPFSLEGFDIDEEEIARTTQDVLVTTPFSDEDNIPTGKTAYTEEDANIYIDSVIENRLIIESDYSKLDPYTLTDVEIENAFIQNQMKETEEQFNSGNNDLQLRNGHLEHLSKLRRISHCTKPVLRASNITFVCYLGFDDVEFKYEASNGNNKFDYEMIASVTDTKMSFRINANQIDDVPHLQDFTIHNIGTFNVKAAKVITDSTCFSERPYNLHSILRHLQTTFVNVLKGKFHDVLNYSVYRTPIQFLNA